MTNSITITLFVLILCVLAADHLFVHLDLAIRAGRMVDHAVEHLSFWR